MRKFSILVLILVLILVVFLSGCNLFDKKLAKKMIEKYSEDQNYVVLIGEIVEYDGNDVIIKCEELKNYLSYEAELCDYYIYSTHSIELSVGEQIEFTTVPFHFYNGHKLPIVEIKKDGEIILSFNEGKDILINWVKTNFK